MEQGYGKKKNMSQTEKPKSMKVQRLKHRLCDEIWLTG